MRLAGVPVSRGLAIHPIGVTAAHALVHGPALFRELM